ncbi:hypothetical protein D9M70_578170 [compost metagenome]
MVEVSSHAINRSHCTQCTDEFIGTAVTHNANGLNRKQNGKSLPDSVVKASLADFIKIDRICFAQDFKLFARDAARATDRKTRTGERMTSDEAVRKTQFLAQYAHFVLEEFAQRLDQLHVHALWQTANIVVRFDRD